jgi:putative addiction module CopG family antidote
MEITLPPAMEQWVRDQVKAGWYMDESEVIRDALRRMRQAEEEREARLYYYRRGKGFQSEEV